MTPNICETIFSWISVIPCCVSRKYWTRKFWFSICSLSQDPLLYTGWRACCNHQMEKILVPFHHRLYRLHYEVYTIYGSIQFYIATANQEVSKLLPALASPWRVTEHHTQSVSSATQRETYAKLTPKQRATIGNCAILHGTSGALRHSKN